MIYQRSALVRDVGSGCVGRRLIIVGPLADADPVWLRDKRPLAEQTAKHRQSRQTVFRVEKHVAHHIKQVAHTQPPRCWYFAGPMTGSTPANRRCSQ